MFYVENLRNQHSEEMNGECISDGRGENTTTTSQRLMYRTHDFEGQVAHTPTLS